ncbi:hypothetical protein POX_f07584 [Penicillium oxalicum]|uniref:Uncharacterized protein n=1 Tax=Penicillium oxalicum (strain 114-2 / CGMCC 5302) TaxID=933388 RepID=S7ZDY2_PENO1|nr:hypothetical protein POX_f07584 [Penicillium oxalicum]EPS28499.1 hypothetical protein PDE_03445 [Penicillium oxalicum 114-2]KAI2787221.1 hypothetical protein POX_f07584 [Penicillium oxalicum]
MVRGCKMVRNIPVDVKGVMEGPKFREPYAPYVQPVSTNRKNKIR